jgi:hypothetical protein
MLWAFIGIAFAFFAETGVGLERDVQPPNPSRTSLSISASGYPAAKLCPELSATSG